mgnify:CR=1 FL=1
MFITKVKWNRFWSNFRELSLLNILSREMNVVLFLLFSRLNMDRLSFVFSLLLIVLVTTAFGSVIKAKKKVKKNWTYVIAYDQNFCS